MSRISPALVVLVALVSSHPVGAVDGAIEIDQARATAGGITPGDSLGFPVTLSLPGHYRLTSNLFVAGDAVVGIDVTADNVVLDLNNFMVDCTLHCTTGIQAPAPRRNIVVKNGTVNRFPAAGVALGNYSVAEKVSVTGSGIGVLVNIASVIRSCVITGNGNGIHTGNASLIESNLVVDNLTGLCGTGTSAFRGSVISDNPTANFCPDSHWFNAGGNYCGGPCPP
jgi:hypothetical protein